jgi:hypothetical protein
MYATFQIDRTGLENPSIGVETVMGSTSHPDGTWPTHARSCARSSRSHADQRKILFENAARLYRIQIRG